jgi:hypothetical protein
LTISALAVVDPRKAQVVELRFFGGLGEQEIAQVLDVSADTSLPLARMPEVGSTLRIVPGPSVRPGGAL